MNSISTAFANCLIFFVFVYDKTVIADNEFKIVPKLYEEIGCTEKIGGNSSTYECPDFAQKDTEKCHLNGKTFDVGENIPDDDLPLCRAPCRCVQFEIARIECAIYECPEYFIRNDPNCVNQYSDIKECCRSSEICDVNNIQSLGTCTVDDQEYRIGQRFYPKQTMYTCLCTSDFNSELPYASNPNCIRINCGMELRSEDLRNGCVPIYNETPSDCAIGWKCPSNDVAIESHSSENETETCTFGELTLKKGDRLKGDENCECSVPPFITCIETFQALK